MGNYIQILALVIVGILLLWFGYMLFFGPSSPFSRGLISWKDWWKKKNKTEEQTEPQVCPVCSRRLDRGQLVKSVAFPSMSGGRERLMHIKGCVICLHDDVPRRCPVCKSNLGIEDFLVSRMFERNESKNHVHVLGCNKCRKV